MLYSTRLSDGGPFWPLAPREKVNSPACHVEPLVRNRRKPICIGHRSRNTANRRPAYAIQLSALINSRRPRAMPARFNPGCRPLIDVSIVQTFFWDLDA